ncbi:MAG: cyclopropane-fatty-acyl-phospholipid synthase family protein [Lentilitoribacter sp.]
MPMITNPTLITNENIKDASKGLPLVARTLVKAVIDLQYGALTIQWPNGSASQIVGNQPGANAIIKLKSYDLAARVIKRGDVGVGESYIDDQWDSPDVTAVLKLICDNAHIRITHKRNALSGLLLKFLSWRNENTHKGSKRNIAAHYDLGNAFYKQWLDPTMTYSSAIYKDRQMSLHDAQNEKYANLIRQTGIGSDDHVLEIGCGWGGFAEFSAREVGCKVKGLTISQEQFDFAKERIFKAGLNDKVDIVFQDYRDETGTYDRIASIEMFEAVGEKYWPTYFDTLNKRLKPEGTAGLQIITIKEELFKAYRAKTDFIQRYIFPGGMLPTPTILKDLAQKNGMSFSNEDIFGHDYADTLVEWRKSFQTAWPKIQPMGFDRRFKRMWEFYMHYCEAGFRSENIDVRQMVFKRPS